MSKPAHQCPAAPEASGRQDAQAMPQDALLSRELQEIAAWIRNVRFKRAFAGVDEEDVFKKIAELDQLYQRALLAERARYDALLQQFRDADKESTGDESTL